jgi:hypothetical protein
MDLTRRIRDLMMKERLMFAYRGIVTSENSIPLLTLLEKEMEYSDFGFMGRKRLFMFVLESLQNVQRHGTGDSYADMSMVVYSKSGNGYTVTTGNVVESVDSSALIEKLEQINSLDQKGQRELYRLMLSNSEFSKKGGAGLGLIEMAKSTGNKLDYEFIHLDKDYSYFILSKTIDEEGSGINFGRKEIAFRGKAISRMEKLMAENFVNMIWCGHLSHGIGKEVLEFTETKLTEEDVEMDVRRRVFSILVELLDNVANYSPGKEAEMKYGMPVTMIKLMDKIYSITTGNLIMNSQISHLKEKIDIINKYDKLGLKDYYVKSLSGQTIRSDSTGNMGLIDMARKSGNELVYQFEKVNELYSYYVVTVNIAEKLH